MTTDDPFLTEVNQDIKIGPTFFIEPGEYFVKSSLVMRKKNRLHILGYFIVQDEDLIFAPIRQR